MQITNALQIGFDGGFNKLTQRITNNSYTTSYWPSTNYSNKYYCTYLVIDSFNLAGHNELSEVNDGWVYNMINHWKQLPGYIFLDYYRGSHESILRQVQPGYAIFYLNNPNATSPSSDGDHTAIVKSISFNSQGDGTLETYDSNVGSVINGYIIAGWDILGTLRGRPGHLNYSVMGFGYAR